MQTSLTIACVLWRGLWPGRERELQTRQYTPVYVNRLFKMVKKHLPLPFKFVCLTNVESNEFDKSIILKPFGKNLPAWWAKINVFDSKNFDTESVFYLDLDVVILNDLTIMTQYANNAFCDVKSFSSLQAKAKPFKPILRPNGLQLLPYYSTCAFKLFNGDLDLVYKHFDMKAINYYKGDQDYLAYVVGAGYRRFPITWARNVKPNDRGGNAPNGDAKILACRYPVKNEQLQKCGFTYLDKQWRGNDYAE